MILENKKKPEQASIKQKNLYKEKDKTIKKDKKIHSEISNLLPKCQRVKVKN